MTHRIRKAVFPVAGMGTRFLPATKAMPKEMLTIVDKPLIQYAVEEARAAGIEEFIFVTGRGKSAIQDHFDHSAEQEDLLRARGKTRELDSIRRCMPKPGQVVYLRQQKPLGLGHAVWCARDLIGDEPFAVLLADDLVLANPPCLRQMIDAYEDGNMVAVMNVPRPEVSSYGVLDIAQRSGRLIHAKGMVEKPAPEDAPSTMAVIGRYILTPSVMAALDRQEPGAGGEIQLTDAIARTAATQPLRGFRFAGHRFDCGSKIGFFEATLAFTLARSDLGPLAQPVVDLYASKASSRSAPSRARDIIHEDHHDSPSL